MFEFSFWFIVRYNKFKKLVMVANNKKYIFESGEYFNMNKTKMYDAVFVNTFRTLLSLMRIFTNNTTSDTNEITPITSKFRYVSKLYNANIIATYDRYAR